MGALTFAFGRGYERPTTQWYKMPALLLPGHRATIRIPASARGKASIVGFGHDDKDRNAVTFVSCPKGSHKLSDAGGRKVTFFSGGFDADTPVCLPLDVKLDRERRWRRVTVPLGVPRC